MNLLPIGFVWDADTDSMKVLPRYLAQARRQFTLGEEYVLEEAALRNMEHHKAYFAVLKKMWDNLPEKVAKRFPHSEHLRHWALVQTGHCTERIIPCNSEKLATQIAALVRGFSQYAVIKVGDDGKTVFVWELKSQRVGRGGMKADEFKKSADDVLDLVLSMIPGAQMSDFRKAAERDAQ